MPESDNEIEELPTAPESNISIDIQRPETQHREVPIQLMDSHEPRIIRSERIEAMEINISPSNQPPNSVVHRSFEEQVG